MPTTGVPIPSDLHRNADIPRLYRLGARRLLVTSSIELWEPCLQTVGREAPLRDSRFATSVLISKHADFLIGLAKS
jgi:hypothetical protein